MQKVTVYYFTKYDIKSDQFIQSQRPATRETIVDRCEGTVLEETAQEVDSSSLDDNGFLIVKKA